VFIVTDYDKTAGELIRLYKFGHQRAAAGSITKLMTDLLYGQADFLPDTLVVPVPTATSRVRERGFDHAGLLSKKVAARLRLEHDFALRRLGQDRQLGARREERLKQLDSSFAVKKPHKIAGRHILLIDDVVTTGGTIIAAAKTLRAAGAKQVDALLFAKRL
jgi:ComF family protein